MTHLINGAAGNIESHSTLDAGQSPLNITAVLDQTHYGFSKLTVLNATALSWKYVHGDGGIIGDELLLLKKPGKSSGGNGTSSSSSSSSVGPTSTVSGIVYTTTEVVTSYTTYCPSATTFTEGSSTYIVTEVSTPPPSTTLHHQSSPPKLIENAGNHADNHKLPLHTHLHNHRPDINVSSSPNPIKIPPLTYHNRPYTTPSVPASALGAASSTAIISFPAKSSPVGTEAATTVISLPAESSPVETAAGSTATGNTISLTGSIPAASSTAPASFTGGAKRVGVGAAMVAGLVGWLGVVGFVL